ncbi:MAG: sugar phosphate isomerase/epimerase [Actinobacteria bacterium]|nr:sugar phosphate isomerase/epimerase [Actinomycetota bacterium]
MHDAEFNLSVVYPQAFPNSREEDLLSDLQRLTTIDSINVIELTTIPDFRVRKEALNILESLFRTVIFLAGLPSFKRKAFLNAEGEDRLRAIEYTKHLIEEASELGASAILVVSGPDVPSHQRDASRSRFSESLITLCQFGESNFPDVQIRLEHTDRDIHRRQLIGPTSDSLWLINEVAERGYSLDLNLDLSHILQLHEDVRTTLEVTRDHCSHFHLSNCVLHDTSHQLFGDHHPPFGYPDSEVGFTELVKTFQDLNELGYLSSNKVTTLGIEVVPLIGDDPWQTLEDAILTIKAAIIKAIQE